MKPLRVLHLPNETTDDPAAREVQVRAAFAQYRKEGLVSEVATIPFPLEAARLGGTDKALDRILQEVDTFRPDLVFWQNIDRFPATPGYLRRLKASPSKPLLVYYDGDPYGRWRLRMPPPVRAMMAEADAVCLCGLGEFEALARRYGARRVLYTPSCFDVERFGSDWTPTLERPDDIAMIGSLWKPRVPFLYIPGARDRRTLAILLSRRFGGRFALYGNGWDGLPSARGALPYIRQQEAIRHAWVNVSWNHFTTAAYYFSDRLAIALAAGVPHITSRQPGYDPFFADCRGLYTAATPGEAADLAAVLLAKPREELIDLGRQARAWAFAHLEATVVYRPLVEACLRWRTERGEA